MDLENASFSSADIPTTEEYNKMLESETRVFWKTFLEVLEATGLRIIELRRLQNDKITINDDNTSTLEIFQTKTGKKKFVFLNARLTEDIKSFQQQQKHKDNYGKFLFHSPINGDTPIHKNSVNKWFKELSIKATGKHFKPYGLRHKKATQLYRLANENKISEDAVLKLMGHGKSIKDKYIHIKEEDRIKILKSQAFREKVKTKEEIRLEKKVDKLNQDFMDLRGDMNEVQNTLKLALRK